MPDLPWSELPERAADHAGTLLAAALVLALFAVATVIGRRTRRAKAARDIDLHSHDRAPAVQPPEEET